MSKRPATDSVDDLMRQLLQGIKTKPKEKLSLSVIPRHILMAILLKLSNGPLCSMRRTCSYLNNMVENNKKKFSRRNIKGIDISVDSSTAYKDPKTYRFIFGAKDTILKFKQKFSLYSSYENYLSGCVIRNFNFGYNTDPTVKQWILQRLELSCDSLKLYEVPSGKEFVELSELVECRRDIIQASSCFGEADLPALVTSRNRLKMTITLGLTGDAADCFEDFKHLGRIYFHHEYEPQRHFENLVKFLYGTSDVGEVIRMKFAFGAYIEDPFESNPVLPPSTLLWDLATIPDAIVGKRSWLLKHSLEPYYIRYVDLPQSTKCAICVVRLGEKYIYLVEKDEKSVFGLLADQLRISFTQEQEFKYLTAKDDEKMELLRDMYILQMSLLFP